MQTELRVILIADITGYTDYLARAGRGDIVALVNQQKNLISPLIEKRPGRIIKWMGDAVLAVFGSATDAIFCGKEILEVMDRESERGSGALLPNLKIVVHAGDVQVDADGDIYGDPVNLTARLEKVAERQAVYFTDSVRQLMISSEIPHEFFGTYEFKGIGQPVEVYRSCFETSPVNISKCALVQTNFSHVYGTARAKGWRELHPLLDQMTDTVIGIARSHGGTNRGVMQTGSFLTFPKVTDALLAAAEWRDTCQQLAEKAGFGANGIWIRTAVHSGEFSALKYTMMGRDIDVVRMLAPAAHAGDILVTEAAREEADGFALQKQTEQDLREARARQTWLNYFSEMKLYKYKATVVG